MRLLTGRHATLGWVAIAWLAHAPCALAQTAYLTGSHTLLAIDTRTGKITARSAENPGVLGNVTVTSDGGAIYGISRADDRKDRVVAFDAATLAVRASIPVSVAPDGIVAASDGRTLYVVENFVVSVIDTVNNTRRATIPYRFGAAQAALSPDGFLLYIAPEGGRALTVLDTRSRKIAASIDVGSALGSLAIAPDGLHAYVADTDDNTLRVIDTRADTVSASIPVGRGPFGVTVTPDGRYAYVTNTGHDFLDTDATRRTETGSVSVVDLAGGVVLTTIGGFVEPRGVAVSPDGSTACVIDVGTASMSVIDTRRRVVERVVKLPDQSTQAGNFVGPRMPR